MYLEDDLINICVYPDGTQSEKPLDFMSDDYERRQTAYCEVCDNELTVHYGEPFASCECGTTEWYL